jgi:hypothetical protein
VASENPTQKLSIWYSKYCNEDWEHTYGIKIQTIDNPGWSLQISLAETPLAGVNFSPIELERTE